MGGSRDPRVRNEKYSISVGKPEGKRQLGRTSRRWENSIRMCLREIGWEGVDWNASESG
jgi:hypothetical protein